jgi:Uma2 family endonuclease
MGLADKHTDIKSSISVADYIQGELESDIRHEYIGGDIYAMVGASDKHNLIILNLATELKPHTRNTSCQLFVTDMKVRLDLNWNETFYYPDILLSCDQDDRESYYRTKPCLLVEVLSPSTERIDRREKMLAYTQIETLQEYILISQDKREVELHHRDNGWRTVVFNEGDVPIQCLNMTVSMDFIYEGIEI